MEHFLLYTPAGSLVMVLVSSAAVALVVWWAVMLAAALVAFGLWLLRGLWRRGYRPGEKA